MLLEAWPALLEEVETTLDCVLFFDAPRAIGFAHAQTHGAIFLRVSDLERTGRLIEELVHEASHVRLDAIMMATPLLDLHDKARYSTPLRREPRTAFGLFHQLFVLRRIVDLHRRVTALFDTEERVRACDQFAQAWDTAQTLNLTISGNSLLGTMRMTTDAPR